MSGTVANRCLFCKRQLLPEQIWWHRTWKRQIWPDPYCEPCIIAIAKFEESTRRSNRNGLAIAGAVVNVAVGLSCLDAVDGDYLPLGSIALFALVLALVGATIVILVEEMINR